MPWDDDDNPHTEQVDIDEHHEWDCIFSKKTVAQWKPNIKCSTCHAGRNRGSRMRVCERCGRMHCAQCKPPETPCEAETMPRREDEEETRQTRASLQDKKEEGKPSEDTAENQDAQPESDNPAALDKLLRQMQERGPAPATIDWIPRTIRPRDTTILTRLISESGQAAELAEGSELEATRWRTSMLLYVAPSLLLSKPKKQKAKRRRRKRRNERKQPHENAEGNPKKTAAGRERRMEQTPEQPHGRLPAQRKRREKKRTRARDRSEHATCRTRRHEPSKATSEKDAKHW